MLFIFYVFSTEDSILVNKSALDRGLFRSTYYRSYTDSEIKYGQHYDEFGIPEEAKKSTNVSGNGKRFDLLDEEDGIVPVGIRVSANDVIIGKTTPITASADSEATQINLQAAINNKNSKILRKDSSMCIKTHEEGIVDSVMLTMNENEKRMAKVKVRKTRIPEVADKLASRHAQKGTIGQLIVQEDMPWTKDGIVPDLIINSHCIPSRMTTGQMLEAVMSKARCFHEKRYDATPFNKDFDMESICQDLHDAGLQRHGWEVLYSGATGERIPALIFIGSTYYQRLKHMVADKFHSRATGITQTLTRQPTEGTFLLCLSTFFVIMFF